MDWIYDLGLNFVIFAPLLWIFVFFFVVRKRFLKAIALALLAAFFSWVLTFSYSRAPKTSPSGPSSITIKILQLNVYREGTHEKKVIDLVRQTHPDILVFQEINSRWAQQLEREFKLDYGWRKIHSKEDHYGLLIFSKIPVEQFEVYDVSDRGIYFLRAALKLGKKSADLWAVRFFSPVLPSRWKIRNAQMKRLSEIIKETRKPVIVVGDYNAAAWSHAFIDFVRDAGLTKPDTRYKEGTWPSYLPAIFRLSIDHLLVKKPIRVDNRTVQPSAGSDHLPVLFEVTL